MDRQRVIELAREAGFNVGTAPQVQRLADLIEREVRGDAEDAARYRWLALRAHKDTAYDRLGLGAHWRIGFHVDDGRLGLDATIDAARKEGK